MLTDIPPRSADRSHGSDLQVPDHAAALTTAIRYQGSAGMAARRAVRAFLEHRKAKQTGLLLPAAACTREPEMTKNTNELSAAPLGRTLPPSPPPSDPPPPAEPDPDAWLADVPVVEADPSDKSLRRSLLGMIEHPILREIATKAPLKSIEQLIVASDNVGLRGVVREAAEGAVRAGGPARKPQGRHRGGDQAQPALAARAVSLLLPPAGARRICSTRTTPTTSRADGRAGRGRAAAGRDHPVPARAARPPARPHRLAAARGARPRRGGLRHQMAEMAGHIAARSISACCAGRWMAPSSTGRRSTGSAARRSCGSAGRRAANAGT